MPTPIGGTINNDKIKNPINDYLYGENNLYFISNKSNSNMDNGLKITPIKNMSTYEYFIKMLNSSYKEDILFSDSTLGANGSYPFLELSDFDLTYSNNKLSGFSNNIYEINMRTLLYVANNQ